jgi:hypothetical protein
MRAKHLVIFLAAGIMLAAIAAFAYSLMMPAPAFGPVTFRITAYVPKEFSYNEGNYSLKYTPYDSDKIWLCNDPGCEDAIQKLPACPVHMKCQLGEFYVTPLDETNKELSLSVVSSGMKKRTLSEAAKDTMTEFFGMVP